MYATHPETRGGILMKLMTAIAMAAGVLLLGSGLTATARAAITSISVVSSTELGRFSHRDYREVQIRMLGTAPGGAYNVPVTLAFPETSKDYSGVAVVDVINTSFVTAAVLPAPATPVPLPLAHIQMGDDYLFGSGHVYLGVHWDKASVAFLGIGTIAAGGDAWTIIRDAAALARNPLAVPADVRPDGVSKVIGYGYSQTGALLRGFHFSHQNTAAGGIAFDGTLFGGSAGQCLNPAGGPRFDCWGAVADGGKVFVLSTENDVQRAGFLERAETADYRVNELAGVSHIARSVVWFDAAPQQNPILYGPAARAALHNLIAWIDGVEPASSNYIALESQESLVSGTRYRNAVRDADGNAVGGVRLPHMTATDSSGEIGAPLGTYLGRDLAQPNSSVASGGRFIPFDSAKLASLYPTHDIYVERVARAAHRLVQRRELLQEDAKAFIREAAHSTIGK
jgi:hypothetical protein